MLRAISQDETPFLQLDINHIAVSHLSRPTGESSKMVPTLTLYCFVHVLHLNIMRVLRNENPPPPQRGHSTPSGQRNSATNQKQTSGLEKNLIASISVSGLPWLSMNQM